MKVIYFMFYAFNIIDRFSENGPKRFTSESRNYFNWGTSMFPNVPDRFYEYYSMFSIHGNWDVWEYSCICPLSNLEEDIYINTLLIYQVQCS